AGQADFHEVEDSYQVPADSPRSSARRVAKNSQEHSKDAPTRDYAVRPIELFQPSPRLSWSEISDQGTQGKSQATEIPQTKSNVQADESAGQSIRRPKGLHLPGQREDMRRPQGVPVRRVELSQPKDAANPQRVEKPKGVSEDTRPLPHSGIRTAARTTEPNKRSEVSRDTKVSIGRGVVAPPSSVSKDVSDRETAVRAATAKKDQQDTQKRSDDVLLPSGQVPQRSEVQDGPKSLAKKRGAAVTAIIIILVFVLFMTGIITSIVKQNRETNPYVLYRDNHSLNVIDVRDGRVIQLSELNERQVPPKWFFQVVGSGDVLFFGSGNDVADYQLNQVDLPGLFGGTEGIQIVAQHVKGPFAATRDGRAIFCTATNVVKLYEKGEVYEISGQVQSFLLNDEESAVAVHMDDQTAVSYRLDDGVEQLVHFPDQVGELLWLSRDGGTLYTANDNKFYYKTTDGSRALTDQYDQLSDVSADGKFYFTVAMESETPLLDTMTDRYKLEDDRLEPPTSETTTTTTTSSTPAENQAEPGRGDLIPEGSDEHEVTVIDDVESNPLDEPATEASSGVVFVEEEEPRAGRPVVGDPNDPPRETSVVSQPSRSFMTSETAETDAKTTTSRDRADVTSLSPTGSDTNLPTQSSEATGTTTRRSAKDNEELREELHRYLEKLRRDELRDILKDETVTLQHNQLWYFDGDNAKLIDEDVGDIFAESEDATAIIYNVSGSISKKNGDLSQITDVSEYIKNIEADTERGYRLASHGISSHLAPASLISDVYFSPGNKFITYIGGEDAYLTNTFMEGDVVFDTVVMDSHVDHCDYSNTTNRLLYYKKNDNGLMDLYENGQRLTTNAKMSWTADRDTFVLVTSPYDKEETHLVRLIPDKDSYLLGENVVDVVPTSGVAGVFIEHNENEQGYRMLYASRRQRTNTLVETDGVLKFVQPIVHYETNQRSGFSAPEIRSDWIKGE
ncbi:MAG TPA: hypothetical protein GX717_02300, partial [Clostridiaceae bacterium]|nr:hypothetical protein [Clostridiaceae bacterium]